MKAPSAALVVIAVLLAGCAVGPRYHAPSAALPPSWTEGTTVPTSGGASLERWWEGFGDPNLDGLVTRALRDNIDLKLAAARVREARAARGIAAAAGLPQLDASTSYARTRRSEAVPPFRGSGAAGAAPFGVRDQDLFEAGFDAGWEIDVFGGVRRDREAALADVQASEFGERDARVTLLAEIGRVYAQLRGVQARERILDADVRSQTEIAALVQTRLDAGLAGELDVARARGLLATLAAERPPLERLEREAIHRLGVLVGTGPGALAADLSSAPSGAVTLPVIPSSLPSSLLVRRPDLRRAERELAAATARVGVARADLYPRLSLVGAFTRRTDDASDLTWGGSQLWAFGPSIRWPVFSSGRLRARVRVEDARREQAEYRYRGAVLAALEEVENALSACEREGQRSRSLEETVAESRRALDLATERYRGGLETFLLVLDAERVLHAAQDQLADSRTRSAVALVAVYKSLGGGWSE